MSKVTGSGSRDMNKNAAGKPDGLIPRLMRHRETGIVAGLIALVLLFSILTPMFFTVRNLSNISRQVSIMGILSAGMTLAILGGGIDLSVGSVVAFVGIMTADIMCRFSLPVPVAIVIGLLVGALAGLINGALVAVIRVPPFIATLGTMTAVRGLTYVYTRGYPIYGLPRSFGEIGAGYLWGVPTPTIIMVVVVAAVHLLLTRTTFGRSVYAIGGNEEAARLSGIRVTEVKVILYTTVGIITALSGIVLASRLRSGLPTAGSGYELNAIAAVILGGASMSGGEGSVLGTIVGTLLLGTLENGLNLMNVDPYILQVLTGVVIVMAVIIDSVRKNRSQSA